LYLLIYFARYFLFYLYDRLSWLPICCWTNIDCMDKVYTSVFVMMFDILDLLCLV